MKKFLLIVICTALLLLTSLPVYADGNPNIDGGGGNTEDGTGTNFWNTGDDGVRVTIAREADKRTMTTPIDYTNRTPTDIRMSFGYKSKLSYISGNSLAPNTGNYTKVTPTNPIPAVVSSSGAINIAAIKDYFSREINIRDICEKTGFDFTELTNGKYVILLEPLVYITYNGIRFCMTATEAALYDRMTDGDLKSKLGNITHQNLPLAMFLETPDLGFAAWSGSTSGIRSNEEIISQLGIGTVRFSDGACCNHALDCPCITNTNKPNDCACKKNHPNEPCGPENPSCDCEPADGPDNPASGTKYYEYRTDTEVITSIEVRDTKGGKSGISPDDGAMVMFTINGDTYTKPFVTPPNDSTPLWVRWHTPETPQKITITVTSTHGKVLTPTVIANVTELTEATPPDPTSRDTNKGFKVPKLPNVTSVRDLTWGEWLPRWHENWVEVPHSSWVETGHGDSCDAGCDKTHGHSETTYTWEDRGWWEYDWKEYYAAAGAKTVIKPAEQVPTAKRGSNGYEMRSGYGINLDIDASVTTSGKNGDITHVQNAVALFPEFDYKTYYRVMQPTKFDNFELRINRYSMYKAPVHFTPIWYPDDAAYTPQTVVFDIWTPSGQLYLYGDDTLTIRDGTYFDDWTVVPKLVWED